MRLVRVLNANNFKSVIRSYSTSGTTCPAHDKKPSTKFTIDYDTKPENWSNAKAFKDIPGPPPLPVVGNMWWFVACRDFVKMSTYFRKRYGDVVIMRKMLSFGDFLFLFNVRDIEWMLRNEGPYPTRDGFQTLHYYRTEVRKDLFDNTLGLLGNFEPWAKFRTTVNPIMMQPRTTSQYIPGINAIAEEFIEHVRRYKAADAHGEMPKDFIQELQKWAFESLAYIALDTRLGCLGPQPSQQALMAMTSSQRIMDLNFELDFMPTGILHKKFKTAKWRSYITSQDFFTNLTLEFIDKVEQRMKTDANYAAKPEQEKSVFEKLVMKDKKVAMVMVLDMLAAGIESTGKASGAILYFLAKNKPAQDSLREELLRLLPTKTTPITQAIIEDAKYLRATIKESLRISPIAHSTVRKTTKNMVVGGYQVPPNILIMMPHIYLSTGIDEHFKDPMAFRPERWLREAKASEQVNPFVNLPFGFGARSCIGKRMANMEMEVFIAKMIRNFHLDWPHKDMTFRQDLTYGIADPLRIRLTDVTK